RKFALPGIGHILAPWREFITPSKLRAIKTAPGGKFPLRLGRELLATPFGIRDYILPSDMHDGVLLSSLQRAFGARGMLPAGTGHPMPPVVMVIHVNPMRGLLKDRRAWHQQFWLGIRIIRGIRGALGHSDVARGFNKFLELG